MLMKAFLQQGYFLKSHPVNLVKKNLRGFVQVLRKFLKKVGITSQKEIERVYDGKGKVKLKMVLSCEELNLKHTIEGEIGAE